jgi:hypothetical protein
MTTNKGNIDLKKEIFLIIIFKLIMLTVIWHFFVHGHKIPDKMAATTQHLIEQ